MLAVALVVVLRAGRDIPLAEDWTLVPALTGHEPDFGAWLWSQNNEHRVPLPRLLMLLMLRVSGGDFRAGMVLNVLTVAAVAAAMIVTARRVRGRTAWPDLFFPVATLHLGHWINIAWSWQIQFVSSFALIAVLLIVVVRQAGPLSTSAATAAATAMVLLPLTGAIGLIFDIALGPWVLATAWPHLRRRAAAPRAPGLLIVGALFVAAVTGVLYFVGYVRPPWNPPSPSHLATLETAARFLALGIGPRAAASWRISVLATAALLAATGLLLTRAFLQSRDHERLRSLGLLSFGGAMIVLALGIGWGRAAQYPTIGLPNRYVIFALPALCAAYFAWLLYGRSRAATLVPAALCAAALVLLPWNTRDGLSVRDWYVAGMDAVQRDVDAGATPAVIAEKHTAFLMHWNREGLAERIRMLRDAGIGPFARAAADEPAPR
jgi:hypothetical protein